MTPAEQIDYQLSIISQITIKKLPINYQRVRTPLCAIKDHLYEMRWNKLAYTFVAKTAIDLRTPASIAKSDDALEALWIFTKFIIDTTVKEKVNYAEIPDIG